MDLKALENLVDKLPESPNILAKERFYNSAVLVPFVKIDGELHFLFQKRAAGIRQGTEICFPGGMFDADKDNNYKDTAIRETIEELGVSAEKIEVKGQLDTLVASLGVTVDSFVALLDVESIEMLTVNTQEVEYIFTLPVQYFIDNQPEKYKVRLEVQPSYTNKKGELVTLLPSKELGLPTLYQKPWGGSLHRVLVYPTESGTIWGITSEIIYEVVNKMG